MKQKPLHIFLDLDLTLVNVFPLWRTRWIKQLAQRTCLRADDVYTKGAAIWERGDIYTLHGHLRELAIDPEAGWARELQADFQKRLREGTTNYDDTGAFLDALAHHELACSIITFGDRAYQQLKVDGLGRLDGFFRGVHCTTAPGEKVLILHEALKSRCVVFLDDSASEHSQVAVIAPTVHRIQIRRTHQIPCSGDAHHVVNNLEQALDVILSLKNNQPKEST